jgi:tetratricopeptide (TPR) repeat protein
MKLVKEKHPVNYIRVPWTDRQTNRTWLRLAAQEDQDLVTRRRAFRWLSLAAAMLLLVFVFAWRAWKVPTQAPLAAKEVFVLAGASVRTTAKVESFLFSDGSKITLAAQSQLQVLRSDDTETRVTLGAGALKIERISSRNVPWNVQLTGLGPADVEMQASGAFSFRCAVNDSVKLEVFQGSVAVVEHATLRRTLVHAGQQWAPENELAAAIVPSATAIAPEKTSIGEPLATSVVTEASQAQALFKRADSAYVNGQLVEAAADFAKLMTKFPKDPRAPVAAYQLGRLRLASLGDAAGAVEAFTFVLRIDPNGVSSEAAEIGRIEATAQLKDSVGCEQYQQAYLSRFAASVNAPRVRRMCTGL